MCCCFRIRIPRTKQEIDADFRRKQLTKRFKQELKRIRNSELDVLDLKRGLLSTTFDFVCFSVLSEYGTKSCSLLYLNSSSRVYALISSKFV